MIIGKAVARLDCINKIPPGKDLPDFSELMGKIELPPEVKLNRRKTRKNKGGRPNRVQQMMFARTEEEKLEAIREEEFGPKNRWDYKL